MYFFYLSRQTTAPKVKNINLRFSIKKNNKSPLFSLENRIRNKKSNRYEKNSFNINII